MRSAASTRLGLENLFHSVFADESDTTELIAPDAWKENWDVQHLPCKAGYIFKKGELNAQWQQRWFVLDQTGVLCWYEKACPEEGQKPRGTLAIWEVSSIKPVDPAAPCVIVLLHIHGRVFELSASSEFDASDWRQILQTWASSARAAVEAYHSQEEENRNDDEEAKECDVLAVSAANVACRKTGFLQKRGGFNTDWRRRWFELDHPGVLTWYEKFYPESSPQKQQKVKGSLMMKEVMCIKVLRRDAPCLIEVAHIQGRTYELLADSIAEAEDWRVQLNLWLREAYSVAKEAQGRVQSVNKKLPPSNLFEETKSAEQPTLDHESVKLEASKKRYFMYSKFGRAHKSKEKRGLAETAPNTFVSLTEPCVTETSLTEKPSEESEKSPSPVQKEPFESVTDAIEALSKHHAEVSAIIARDPLAGSEEPEECFVVPPTASSDPVVSPTTPAPLAASRRPFFMSRPISTPNSVQKEEICSDNRRPSASPGALSSLYGHAEDNCDDFRSPSPVLMVTENPHRKALTPRRGSTVQFSPPTRSVSPPAPPPRRRSMVSAEKEQHGRRAKRQNVLSNSPTLAKQTSRGSITHRDSDLADTKFMDRMGKRHSSELVNNLQKRSYKDINAEFWDTHLWYLACVVCFVTLNVLYTTSYIMTQNEI